MTAVAPSDRRDARRRVRAARRARVLSIRKRVAGASAAAFIALFSTIYIQMATGHDPALAASARTASSAGASGSSSAGASGSSSAGAAMESDDGAAAAGAGAAGTSAGGSGASSPAPVTTSQS